jgi:hypothetical protein
MRKNNLFLQKINKTMKYLKLLLFLLTFSVYSQNIELKWAEKIKTKDNVTILGGNKGNFFTSHKDKDKHLVCRSYDSNMNLVEEKIVNFNLDSKKYVYDGAYFLKDRIVHFVEENVRKEDKNYLYGATTDFKLKTSDKTFVLDEADEKASYFGQRRISPDSTKILVYNQTNGKKNDPNILNFKVYDASFKDVLLNKSVELPIKSKNFSTENIGVDNLGNVFVLAKIIKEKDEKAKDQSLSYYKLVVFNKDKAAKEFDFDYPNKDIESIDIIPGDNNTLICTGFLKILNKGFFGKGKKTLISDEMFTSIIDSKTLTLKSANKYELEGLYPDKLKSADYVPYKVRDIFSRKDGGSVVVAEQYKLVVTTTYSQQGGTRTTYKYYYCDIATIHINSKSEVESVSKMPKYQLNAANPSIISTHFNGSTYIVYEDLEKNADAENDKDTKRSTKSMFSSSSKNALFLLTITPSGKMKKEIIYSYKESKIRPRVLSSKVVSKNEIILNADDQIGLLKFSI